MAQVESDIVPGNVRDMVNRLSRDMTNRAPFSVHQQIDRRPLPAVSVQPSVQLFVATYAYTSKQEDELSFVAGDVIELITEVEDGWSRGKLKSNGTIGMFPTNFVAPKVVTTSPPSTATAATNSATATTSASRPKTGNSEVVMRAEPKAIDRTPSTIISEQSSVLKTTEPKYTNVSTVMPSSASSEISSTDSLKMKEMARVKFVYVPQHDDELALKDIDMLLNITTKNCGDAGWFEGELNGKKGLFPDNFVELVQVPVGTESGAKYSSVSRATALNLSHKPPPMNPPQPAVPPKPSKVATTDPIPSTILPATQAPVATTSTNNMPSVNAASKNNNFAALREKMSNNLKVVAPEKVASIQQKPTEPRDRASTIESSNGGETPIDNNSSGDQVTELQHITKNRARPPKNRPMSMVMNRHRSSDESPTGRLSSPTSGSTINTMSASMFVAPPATKDILIPSNSTASSSPFKTSSAAPATVAPPSSASKPALRPIASNSFAEHHDSSVIRKLASPDSSSSSEYVSRSEYDDLLDRFRALEARVIALEKLRS